MKGSHSPSLSTLVERGLRRAQLPDKPHLVLAVSGGPDSMALGHALGLLRRKIPLKLLVVTCDHGLRKESADEVRLVQGFCANQGLECVTRQLELAPGPNLQERAREARYRALWEIADGCGPDSFVITAHQSDDRAETVLLRLLRGTSPEGLGVLPLRSGRLLRPMIDASRADVLLHLDRHQLPFCHDPSNDDSNYTRVRVRREVLPLLEAIQPGVARKLSHLAEEAHLLEEPLGLNREQRDQLRKALRNPKIVVDLPLGSGLRLRREQHGFRSK